MNIYSGDSVAVKEAADTRPILIIPYMWIGDFVRGHSLVRLLNQRWPNRPVDLLTTTLCAPLIDYMPGVRAGIVWDLPRSRLALAKQRALAEELRARNYGTAIVLPRTWKSAIAPALAGIPERVGFVGEVRFGLINQWRWGEKALAAEIVATGGKRVRDLTGTDLRDGILAMAAAQLAISNDSGLMHVAAALGTPTMGIFGPTSPYHWAPLNPLAATVQTRTVVPCQPCHRPICTMNDHRCMREIPASDVVDIAQRVLAEARIGAR